MLLRKREVSEHTSKVWRSRGKHAGSEKLDSYREERREETYRCVTYLYIYHLFDTTEHWVGMINSS